MPLAGSHLYLCFQAVVIYLANENQDEHLHEAIYSLRLQAITGGISTGVRFLSESIVFFALYFYCAKQSQFSPPVSFLD